MTGIQLKHTNTRLSQIEIEVMILQGRRRYLYQVVPMMITHGWVWSILLASPPLLGWGRYLPEESGMRYRTCPQGQ